MPQRLDRRKLAVEMQSVRRAIRNKEAVSAYKIELLRRYEDTASVNMAKRNRPYDRVTVPAADLANPELAAKDPKPSVPLTDEQRAELAAMDTQPEQTPEATAAVAPAPPTADTPADPPRAEPSKLEEPAAPASEVKPEATAPMAEPPEMEKPTGEPSANGAPNGAQAGGFGDVMRDMFASRDAGKGKGKGKAPRVAPLPIDSQKLAMVVTSALQRQDAKNAAQGFGLPMAEIYWPIFGFVLQDFLEELSGQGVDLRKLRWPILGFGPTVVTVQSIRAKKALASGAGGAPSDDSHKTPKIVPTTPERKAAPSNGAHASREMPIEGTSKRATGTI